MEGWNDSVSGSGGGNGSLRCRVVFSLFVFLLVSAFWARASRSPSAHQYLERSPCEFCLCTEVPILPTYFASFPPHSPQTLLAILVALAGSFVHVSWRGCIYRFLFLLMAVI